MSVPTASQFTAANLEYLSVASNAALQMGDIDCTFFAWVYADALGTVRDIITKHTPTGNQRSLIIGFSTPPRFRFIVSGSGTSGTTSTVLADAFGDPVISIWYFIVAWHDATGNTINIQINNGTANSTAHTTGVFANTTDFLIGARGDITSFWNGRIQGVGVLKRLLTADEKTFLYNGGAGRLFTEFDATFKTSMVAYWALDETSSTRNDSFSTNHLTDNNTVTSAEGVTISMVSAGTSTASFVGANEVVSFAITGTATAAFAGVDYMTIGAAVVARAKAHAGLHALIAGRMYAGKAGRTATSPFVVYQVVSATRPRTFGKRAQIVMSRIQFDVYADSKVEAEQVKQQLIDCYDVWSGLIVLESQMEDEREFVELHDTLGQLRRHSMDFMFNYENQDYV